MTCIFCKIADGSLPTPLIYQDEHIVAFDDIRPQAPQHKIIIPRKHIATLNDIQIVDQPLLGAMIATGVHLAKELGIQESGYRLVSNCNADGGQSVFHIHVHLLGGRHMAWPPG